MPTAILKCTCASEFQDKQHGRGLRVHNVCGPDRGTKSRCTVCGKEKSQGVQSRFVATGVDYE